MEKTDRDAEGQEENEIIPDCDMLDRGAEGAICQPLDLQKKGAGAYGYIQRFVYVCDYGMCADNSCCYNRHAQKIAPSSW